MKKHLEPESLSAYLDGELSGVDRSAVEQHLSTCADCSAVRARLASAMGSVSSLGPVTLAADEHRVLRQAILKSRPAPSAGRRFGFPRWALAGGFALVAVTALAFSFLRPGGADRSQEALTEAGAPASGEAEFNFSSGDEVDRTVDSLPEVAAGLKMFRAGDVRRDGDGSNAESFSGSADSSAGNPSSPGVMARAETPGSGATAGAPVPPLQAPGPTAEGSGPRGTGSPPADQGSGEGVLNSAGELFSNRAADECLGKVIATQNYPMVSLVAREASFQGRPAWLLVFAWSPDATDSQPLDEWQSWLVDPVDCRDFSGQDLVSRALYRSYSNAP